VLTVNCVNGRVNFFFGGGTAPLKFE